MYANDPRRLALETLDGIYHRAIDAQRIGLEFQYCHGCQLDHVRPEGTPGELNYCSQCGTDVGLWTVAELEDAHDEYCGLEYSDIVFLPFVSGV